MLRQRGTIERPTAGGSDRYGNAAYTLTQAAADVPCRVIESRRKRIDPNTAEWAWMFETHILFGRLADVQRGDQVVVDGVTYRVVSIGQRRDAWGAARLIDALAEALA